MSRKTLERPKAEDDDMRPEYDFRDGERGKHYPALRDGYTVRIHESDGTITVNEYLPRNAVLLDPDVEDYFPDSQSVNSALRGLIALIPKKRANTRKRTASK